MTVDRERKGRGRGTVFFDLVWCLDADNEVERCPPSYWL